MWTIYANEIGLAAVVVVLLLAGVIALCSRDAVAKEIIAPLTLSDEDRSVLLSRREAMGRPETQRMQRRARRGIKGARSSVGQQASGKSADSSNQ